MDLVTSKFVTFIIQIEFKVSLKQASIDLAFYKIWNDFLSMVKKKILKKQYGKSSLKNNSYNQSCQSWIFYINQIETVKNINKIFMLYLFMYQYDFALCFGLFKSEQFKI